MKALSVSLFNSVSKMSRIKNGCTTAKDADDKLENQLDRILDSNACRKLFTWARPKDAGTNAAEVDKEIKEEQRLRWNFDFETETPLPGRYQWVRTDTSIGQQKVSDAVRSRVRNVEVVRRATRQKHSTPYSRPPPSSTQTSSSLESAGSCDTTLNRPRRSERKSEAQLDDASSCEVEWN